MKLSSLLQSQYLAALSMLEEAVQKCPASVWDDAQDHNAFWRVSYHVLFYTHLYLQPVGADFQPWAKQRGEAQFLGRLFFEGNREPVLAAPYTPVEILEYLSFCRNEVTRLMPKLDFEGPSGFGWLPFGKLELQLYNIRHIQHHTGELYERLGSRAGVELGWFGQMPVPE